MSAIDLGLAEAVRQIAREELRAGLRAELARMLEEDDALPADVAAKLDQKLKAVPAGGTRRGRLPLARSPLPARAAGPEG